MKFYQATIIDADEGTCYVWGVNKTHAKTLAKHLLSEIRSGTTMKDVVIDEITLNAVADLVAWLNTVFTRDNG